MNEQAALLGFRSHARVTSKRFGVSPQGTLTLADGRLRFERGGRVDFDVPVEEVHGLCSPRYMIGAGFRFDLHGKRWCITFNRLVVAGAGIRSLGPAGELAGAAFTAIDLGGQWTLARAWKDVFARAALLGQEAAAATVAQSDSRYMNASILAPDQSASACQPASAAAQSNTPATP
jgi:hypothetical protein